jgi:hypothetical protein
MGLFDKLIKEGAKALQEAASEENREKAVNVFNSLKDSASDLIKEAASEENREKAAAFLNGLKESIVNEAGELKETVTKQESDSIYEYDETDQRTCREKLLQILADEFPQYEIRENVSPHTIGGTGRFMDYSIGVYLNNVPKLFIMLIGKTTASHREYRWSREEAEKNGITLINFINHYPNRPEYITARLHQYLQ